MDHKEMGCEHVKWIKLAYNRNYLRAVMNEVMNIRVPWWVRNLLTK